MSKELDVNEIVKELDITIRKCKSLNEAKSGLNRYDGLCYGDVDKLRTFNVVEQINHMLEVCSERIRMNEEILGCLTTLDWDKATGKTLWILYNRINREE